MIIPSDQYDSLLIELNQSIGKRIRIFQFDLLRFNHNNDDIYKIIQNIQLDWYGHLHRFRSASK